RRPVGTDGLDDAVHLSWSDLLRVVYVLGAEGTDPAINAFRASLAARAATCDLAARASDNRAAMAALASYAGTLDSVLRWLAARSTPPGDTLAPPGCTPPGPAASDVSGSAFGSFGSGPGQFDRPTDIAVDASGIYVADQGNSRIEHFAADGT